jgi:uncharacterized membrane protein
MSFAEKFMIGAQEGGRNVRRVLLAALSAVALASAALAQRMPTSLPVNASSGNVAAATATATLAGVDDEITYITGFELTGAGATAASNITGTITGLAGGTMSYVVSIPAGVTVGIEPLVVEFSMPLAASGPNTAIVVSFPSFGTGNTNAVVNAHGYQQ